MAIPEVDDLLAKMLTQQGVGQITDNFSFHEFDCHDGTKVPIRLYPKLAKLIVNLEILRHAVGDKPIVINSGYRSPSYNKKIGGATASQHMQAAAADIKITGWSPSRLHKLIAELIRGKQMTEGGLGLYKTFVHYDVRGYRSRWTQ